MPASSLSSVDLPAPLGPMRPMRSPSETVKLTCSNKGRAPKAWERSRTESRMATEAYVPEGSDAYHPARFTTESHLNFGDVWPFTKPPPYHPPTERGARV